ncbi:MAG: urease accessory protein UreF [Rhodospirillaceae bacterium]|nr:urease accessory protein UreF [Rhodospirillaceae bacterium]
MPDDHRTLYRLMSWLSPSFPVGAYSYSHGIEHAVEAGLVADVNALIEWVEGLLVFGSAQMDATLLCEGHRAAAAGDWQQVMLVAERGDVLRGSTELALENGAQGEAFLTAVRRAWPEPSLDRWAEMLEQAERRAPYAVAVGVVAAVARLPLGPSVAAFLHAFVANLVSAAVRLVPLGQTDGQRAIAALERPVVAAADQARAHRLDTMGSASLMVDWTSMRHETQEVRLFRS